ncbi:MAG: kelch repeat-containing protein [Candidatus Pacebacteria bacterium]|nr:kelch repeat-containing protein [Candidatus Paceibacterota bacterium]
MKDRRNEKLCEKHNGKIKEYRCSKCHDPNVYCSDCYFQHLQTEHDVPSPIYVPDDVEKRISQIEKQFDGDEEKATLRDLNKLAINMRQKIYGQLKEARVPIEEMKKELDRMLLEVDTRGTEAGRCVEQLFRKITAAELGYDNRKEWVKAKLRGIKSMHGCEEAEKASIQVENEVKAMQWINPDAIKGKIKECEEATEKLRHAYREIKRRVITREENASMRAEMKQSVSKFLDKQLEECKNKIERRLRESVGEMVKGFDKVIKGFGEEMSKFENERKKRNDITRQLNISVIRAEDLEGQLVEKKNELEREKQKGERESATRLDTEKKLASEMKDLKSLQRENEWLKEKERILINDSLKFQDMLKEKNLDDERYAEAPKMASSIYTYHYPYIGGSIVYLYNTITKKASTLTFDYAHPEKFSSAIIVGSNLYIVGGGDPSPAVYSLAIADGVSECKAIKKKGLSTARCALGLAQYAGKYIYAIGGLNKGAVKCCEKYNIEQDSWSALKDLNEARSELSVCVMNEFIYAIAGGPRGAEKKSVERMSIFKEDDGWEMLAIDNADKGWTARIGCGVCKINEDTIIVFGGYCDKKYTNECYLMKPVKNATV